MAGIGTLTTRLTQLISNNSTRATASTTRLLCNSAPTQTEDHNNKGAKTEQASKTDNQQHQQQQQQVNKEIKAGEIGGPRGPEPTRYGDWERNGRCSDF